MRRRGLYFTTHPSNGSKNVKNTTLQKKSMFSLKKKATDRRRRAGPKFRPVARTPSDSMKFIRRIFHPALFPTQQGFVPNSAGEIIPSPPSIDSPSAPTAAPGRRPLRPPSLTARRTSRPLPPVAIVRPRRRSQLSSRLPSHRCRGGHGPRKIFDEAVVTPLWAGCSSINS